MTGKMYDSHHGLISVLGTKNYCQEQIVDFTHGALQKCALIFKK